MQVNRTGHADHTFSSYGRMPTAFSCSLLMSVPSCSSELGFASTCARKVGHEAETQRTHWACGPSHSCIAQRAASSKTAVESTDHKHNRSRRTAAEGLLQGQRTSGAI